MKSEKEFEIEVREYLDQCGCWVLKTWGNGVQRKGIPDLLVCCGGFFVGVEVKSQKGHASDLQIWNIEKIREAGGVAMVLYPDQFEAFKVLIEKLLKSSDPDKNGFYAQWIFD